MSASNFLEHIVVLRAVLDSAVAAGEGARLYPGIFIDRARRFATLPSGIDDTIATGRPLSVIAPILFPHHPSTTLTRNSCPPSGLPYS